MGHDLRSPIRGKACGCSGVRWCARCLDPDLRASCKMDDPVVLPPFLRGVELPRASDLPAAGRLAGSSELFPFDPVLQKASGCPDFEGVHLFPDFVSQDEARLLLREIEQRPFAIAQSGKRKQHYGPRINFNKRKMNIEGFVGLPGYAHRIEQRMRERAEPAGDAALTRALADFRLSDVFVLRYEQAEASNLDFHLDDTDAYAELIADLSLSSDSHLTFLDREPDEAPDLPFRCIRIPLPARSLLILFGPARYRWAHALLAQDIRGDRTSITLRSLAGGLRDAGRPERARGGAAHAFLKPGRQEPHSLDILLAMSRPFPKPKDKYPVIFLEDTDVPLPDHVINNTMRYTGFKTIAKGGKCLIQSCKDYHLSRVVAMKSLRKELADDPLEQRRFLREARVSAMLQHPNTIPTYELSRNNKGNYYFTMKLVEGLTLQEVIDLSRESEFYYIEGYGLDRMVSILIQVGHALDYAHNHGVIHRDVKPGNILMGPFGEVVLLDWGLAKVWDAKEDEDPKEPVIMGKDPTLTGQGALQGTALYMSPEQIAEAKSIDERTDVYSLGAVLYESLTLEPMIEGETLQEICENAKNVMPPPPSARAPDRIIPADLETLCMRCVAKDPDERFETVHALVTELQAWRARRVRSAGGVPRA